MKIREGDKVKINLFEEDYRVKWVGERMVVLETENKSRQFLTTLNNLKSNSFSLPQNPKIRNKINRWKEDINMTKKEETKRKKSTMKKKEIEFTLFAPDFREVFLAGDFNSWNPQTLPMQKDINGVWRIKLKLHPGRYQYKFFTDGAWFEGPLSDTEVITNPFGTQNFIKEIR